MPTANATLPPKNRTTLSVNNTANVARARLVRRDRSRFWRIRRSRLRLTIVVVCPTVYLSKTIFCDVYAIMTFTFGANADNTQYGCAWQVYSPERVTSVDSKRILIVEDDSVTRNLLEA